MFLSRLQEACVFLEYAAIRDDQNSLPPGELLRLGRGDAFLEPDHLGFEGNQLVYQHRDVLRRAETLPVTAVGKIDKKALRGQG